jgi:F-type H+-transporting ATPase subunit epsilon
MSATTAAVPFWRAAGMTYIGYSNICAALVRNCLKEPFKSEAASREKVHFSVSKWEDGKQEKPSECLAPLHPIRSYPAFLMRSAWVMWYGGILGFVDLVPKVEDGSRSRLILWLTDLFLTMSGVILICVLGVSALHGQS